MSAVLSLNSFVIILSLRLPPDHSRPAPGIALDLRSMMAGGLYCGNLDSGLSGCKKALGTSFSRYYLPTATASRVSEIRCFVSFSTTFLICPLLRVLHLLMILDRSPFPIAFVEIL